jgi:polyisoprenoid-binding protein YceI
VGLPLAPRADPTSYQVDPAQSRVLIQVGKSGAFSFLAGHEHEVETHAIHGVVHFDPQDALRASVRVEIDAATLRVTGKGEPPGDVPKVQEVMLSNRVLDVRRYPTIVFQSRRVDRKSGDGRVLDLVLTGDLTLHNVTRSLPVPLTVRIEGDKLTASGHVAIKQTDYDIKPVTVAGVVTVKDALEIAFTIVAATRPAAHVGATMSRDSGHLSANGTTLQ